MTLDDLRQELETAAGLAPVAAAAHRAFAAVLPVIRLLEDPASEWFSVAVLAAGRAADGRDALALLAARLGGATVRGVAADDSGEAVVAEPAQIAALGRLLADRLAAVAAGASPGADRAALDDARLCALDIGLSFGSG